MELDRFLESKEADMIRFTQKLICIRSENGNETAVAKVVAAELRKFGVKSRLVGEDRKRLNLVADVGRGGKTLLICGHMDTVPAGDQKKWRYPPFSAKIVGSKLFGRGSYDMKTGLVAATYALAALKKTGLKKGRVRFLGTAAEETNMAGVKYLIKKGYGRAGAAIIAEALGSTKPIKLGGRGVSNFEIIVKGKSAHTGIALKKGVNAVTKAAKIVLALEKIRPRYKKAWGFEPPSVVPVIISGGTAMNIVPDECRIKVNCRLSYGQTRRSIRKDIERALAKLKHKDPKLSAALLEISYIPPAATARNEPIVKIVQRNVKKIHGIEPTLGITGGATDGNIITAAGIPSVVAGARGKNLHTENEFCYLPSILKAAKVMAHSAIEFLR